MKQRYRAENDAHFDSWKEQVEVKMLLSILPAAHNVTQQDVLSTLLKSAFQRGVESGTSNVVGKIMEKMFREKADKSP